RILQDERLPDAKGLAVDLEGALALFVLDPEVVPDREHLLAHPVRRPAADPAASQQWHRIAPFGFRAAPAELTLAAEGRWEGEGQGEGAPGHELELEDPERSTSDDCAHDRAGTSESLSSGTELRRHAGECDRPRRKLGSIHGADDDWPVRIAFVESHDR